jgi:membrane-bound lytic murein transglycosylase B
MLRYGFCFFLLFCLLTGGLAAGPVPARAAETIFQRLAKEPGIDRQLVSRLRKSESFNVDTGIVAKNLKQSEYKAAYERFLAPPAVKRAQAFLRDNRMWLARTGSRYGVEPEVIVAIFLVESDLGRYPGRYPLLKVFSLLALCDRKEYVDRVYKKLKPDYPKLDYAWLQRRARKKAAWGYRQLVALLKLADRLEVEKVKGSWAGAFGICQFIPTSCLSYAVDGSGDGRIDLYDFADAAASVANYLKINGWRPGLDRRAREKVVWTYNHSKPYCETIVELTRRLEKAGAGKKKGSS